MFGQRSKFARVCKICARPQVTYSAYRLPAGRFVHAAHPQSHCGSSTASYHPQPRLRAHLCCMARRASSHASDIRHMGSEWGCWVVTACAVEAVRSGPYRILQLQLPPMLGLAGRAGAVLGPAASTVMLVLPSLELYARPRRAGGVPQSPAAAGHAHAHGCATASHAALE